MNDTATPGAPHLPGVAIDPLPWFGTTWYERGPAYWWRRVAVSVGLLFCIAVLMPFVIGALSAIDSWGHIALVIALAVMASAGVATATWMWRTWWVDVPAPSGRTVSAAAGGGAPLGVLARAGLVLAGALLVVGALILVAPMLVLFVISLGRQLPPERRARRTLEHALEQRREDVAIIAAREELPHHRHHKGDHERRR